LLLASFLAYSEHQLHLGWIIVVATWAATLGGYLGYAFGYYGDVHCLIAIKASLGFRRPR